MSSAELVSTQEAPQLGDQARVSLGLLAGCKVLAEFYVWLVVKDLRTSPSPRERGEARRKTHDEFLAALKAADIALLRIVRETEGENVGLGLDYRGLFLLDCRGQALADAVRKLPHFGGGIVFQDGAYLEGIPYPAERLKEQGAPNLMAGSVPAPCGYEVWGSGDLKRRAEDLERYKKIAGLRVDYTPPSGASGNLGHAVLTPEGKLTLLEVFLRTQARFQWQQPGPR